MTDRLHVTVWDTLVNIHAGGHLPTTQQAINARLQCQCDTCVNLHTGGHLPTTQLAINSRLHVSVTSCSFFTLVGISLQTNYHYQWQTACECDILDNLHSCGHLPTTQLAINDRLYVSVISCSICTVVGISLQPN